MNRKRIYIVYICFLFLFSDASAQTIGDRIIERIDSLITSYNYDPQYAEITADTSLPIKLSRTQGSQPQSVIQISAMDIVRFNFNSRRIIVSGTFTGIQPPKQSTDFTFTVMDDKRSTQELKPTSTILHNNDEEETLWDSVIQPVLVTAGAAVVVLLFFVISF
jgi:hypothetical protein